MEWNTGVALRDYIEHAVGFLPHSLLSTRRTTTTTTTTTTDSNREDQSLGKDRPGQCRWGVCSNVETLVSNKEYMTYLFWLDATLFRILFQRLPNGFMASRTSHFFRVCVVSWRQETQTARLQASWLRAARRIHNLRRSQHAVSQRCLQQATHQYWLQPLHARAPMLLILLELFQALGIHYIPTWNLRKSGSNTTRNWHLDVVCA